ncbi:MAG TPA: hypothetical protein PK082_02365 [Phycisphaerae bacterium]|nr:hypothetical protein [Phycisphaerae bacterium]
MSLPIDVAEALKTAVNGGEFSAAFEAVRAYAPRFDLAELADLHVTVVPRGVALSVAARKLSQTDVQVDLAVQKKLSADSAANPALELAELDALMDLSQEIGEFVARLGRLEIPGGVAVWTATENAPVYAIEHLREFRQFTGVLTFTFRAMRAT